MFFVQLVTFQLLQNLGKADKTTDELFDVYVNNFNKQQNTALRLQKELKNYSTCMRGENIMYVIGLLLTQYHIGRRYASCQQRPYGMSRGDL